MDDQFSTVNPASDIKADLNTIDKNRPGNFFPQLKKCYPGKP